MKICSLYCFIYTFMLCGGGVWVSRKETA